MKLNNFTKLLSCLKKLEDKIKEIENIKANFQNSKKQINPIRDNYFLNSLPNRIQIKQKDPEKTDSSRSISDILTNSKELKDSKYDIHEKERYIDKSKSLPIQMEFSNILTTEFIRNENDKTLDLSDLNNSNFASVNKCRNDNDISMLKRNSQFS